MSVKNSITNYENLPVAMTPEDFAQVMGMSKNNVYQLMHSAAFPSFKVGRKLYVSKNAFIRWLEGMEASR